MLHQEHVVSGPACIETLESRRLMSASPISHAVPALVETHAVKIKAPIPLIGGTTYTGTFKALGHVFSLSFVFGAESATGALTATVSSDVASSAIFPCTGTVKNTRAVALHGKEGKLTLKVAAKLSSDLGTLSGKATAHGKAGFTVAFTTTKTQAM
jgi:hypothetical protein